MVTHAYNINNLKNEARGPWDQDQSGLKVDSQ